MKKAFKIFALFSTTILSTGSCVACSLPFDPKVDPNPPNPPAPDKKDIKFYQQDIKNLHANIASIKNDLIAWNSADNKKAICGSISECKAWKIGEIMYYSDLNEFNAQIEADTYQILLLENNNILSLDAIQKAKKILHSELNYLNEQIKILTNALIINDTKHEVEKIKQKIDYVHKTLQDL